MLCLFAGETVKVAAAVREGKGGEGRDECLLLLVCLTRGIGQQNFSPAFEI